MAITCLIFSPEFLEGLPSKKSENYAEDTSRFVSALFKLKKEKEDVYPIFLFNNLDVLKRFKRNLQISKFFEQYSFIMNDNYIVPDGMNTHFVGPIICSGGNIDTKI